jgi:hypothetical protein
MRFHRLFVDDNFTLGRNFLKETGRGEGVVGPDDDPSNAVAM